MIWIKIDPKLQMKSELSNHNTIQLTSKMNQGLERWHTSLEGPNQDIQLNVLAKRLSLSSIDAFSLHFKKLDFKLNLMKIK